MLPRSIMFYLSMSDVAKLPGKQLPNPVLARESFLPLAKRMSEKQKRENDVLLCHMKTIGQQQSGN